MSLATLTKEMDVGSLVARRRRRRRKGNMPYVRNFAEAALAATFSLVAGGGFQVQNFRDENERAFSSESTRYSLSRSLSRRRHFLPVMRGWHDKKQEISRTDICPFQHDTVSRHIFREKGGGTTIQSSFFSLPHLHFNSLIAGGEERRDRRRQYLATEMCARDWLDRSSAGSNKSSRTE